MVDLVRRAFLVGVGALALTRDRVEQFVNDSVARGELTAEQGKGLVEELTGRAEEQQKKVQTFVGLQVDRALENAGLAPRSEVSRLEQKLDAIESRLRELSRALNHSEPTDSFSTSSGPASAPATASSGRSMGGGSITVEPPTPDTAPSI